MKKIVAFTAAALATCLAATAQNPDTLRVKNVSEVVVITTQNSQTISLKGSANDSTFRYESSIGITPESSVSVRENRLDLFNWDVLQSRRQSKYLDDEVILAVPGSESGSDNAKPFVRITHEEIAEAGFGFAMTYDGPSGIELASKPLSDIFIGVESVSVRFGSHVALNTGLDLGYRSFRLAEEGIFAKHDGQVILEGIPAGMNLKRSALRSNYLAVPLTLSLSFGRYEKLRMFGGAEICFNFNGRVKNAYTQKDTQIPTKYTDVKLEPWTWNYVAGISFGELGFYAKYSPCPFLQQGAGPAFNTYSAGIIFNM